MHHPGSSERLTTTRWPNLLLLLVRAGWGAALMLHPRRVGDLVGPELSHTTWGQRVLRVLAGRHLGQAAVTALRPTRTVVLLGAAVDLLHALSAVVFALASRRYRRSWLRDAGLATGFGVAGAAVARGMANTPDEEWASGPVPPAGRRALPASAPDGATVPVPSRQGAPAGTTDPPTMPPPRTGSRGADDPSRAPAGRPSADDPSRAPAGRPSADDSHHSTRAVVHPRVMWAGVLLLLIGMFAIAWAMLQRSETWIIVGVVVMAVGALLAWRGGILKDVQATQPMTNEVEAAVHGHEHEGIEAGQQLHDPRAQAAAARTARETRAVLQSRASAPGPPIGPVATLGLLLLGAWLFVGSFMLPYYYTVTGVNSTNRALGAAVVVVLCALWMRHVRTGLVAAGLAALVGLALLVGALLLTHNDIWVRYQEGVCGALIVLCAALAALSGIRQRRSRSVPRAGR